MLFKNGESIIDLTATYEILKPLSTLYPDFKNWYWDKVVPGVVLGNDKVILMKNNHDVVGVSIIKNSFNEKKLRCLRIHPKYQKKGVGLYLIDESLKQLGTDKPTCSVSEEMMNDFSRIFINKYGFDLSHVYNGIYRKGKLEYEFNGKNKLKEKSIYF